MLRARATCTVARSRITHGPPRASPQRAIPIDARTLFNSKLTPRSARASRVVVGDPVFCLSSFAPRICAGSAAAAARGAGAGDGAGSSTTSSTPVLKADVMDAFCNASLAATSSACRNLASTAGNFSSSSQTTYDSQEIEEASARAAVPETPGRSRRRRRRVHEDRRRRGAAGE